MRDRPDNDRNAGVGDGGEGVRPAPSDARRPREQGEPAAVSGTEFSSSREEFCITDETAVHDRRVGW